jgi:hypothetical protein
VCSWIFVRLSELGWCFRAGLFWQIQETFAGARYV